MAYVPDNPDLYENMRAIDFINFICDMYDTSLDIRTENITKYAKILQKLTYFNPKIAFHF